VNKPTNLLVRFWVSRLARGVLTLAGVSGLVFGLMALAPGDPARLALRGERGRGNFAPDAIAAFRKDFRLDEPLPVRFAVWMSRAARLDFGRSLQDGRAVKTRIAETLPITVAVNGAALVLGLFLAGAVGVAASFRPGSRLDRVLGLVFDLLYASPPFVVGLLLLLSFAVSLPLFPLFGGLDEGGRGLVLPVVTLALALVAPAARTIRAIFIEAFRSGPALAGRSRGEDTKAEILRGLRGAAAPLAALCASVLPVLVGGSVIVERLFSIRGTGALLAEAVFARDLPTVLALTLLSTAVVVIGSIAADLTAAFFDPRIASMALSDSAGLRVREAVREAV
jgi:peptide/nickel transport system permease protein